MPRAAPRRSSSSHGDSLLVDTPNGRLTTAMPSASSPPRKSRAERSTCWVTTHFHGTTSVHMPHSRKLIPIACTWITVLRRTEPPNVAALYKLYEEQTAGKRRILKPGDRFP